MSFPKIWLEYSLWIEKKNLDSMLFVSRKCLSKEKKTWFLLIFLAKKTDLETGLLLFGQISQSVVVGNSKARNMSQSLLPPDVRKKCWGLSGPAASEGTRDCRALWTKQDWKVEAEDLLSV